MVAVVVYTSPALEAFRLLALGIGIIAAALVLIAHLARPKVQRFIAACALVCAFAGVARVVLRADEPGFVITNPCKGLTPSDLEWWIYGCMWPV
jgi:hypothetical protein